MNNGGHTQLVELPCPHARSGHLMIQTRMSLLSAGTEKMLVDFGRANLFRKARQQPDKIRMVLEKIKTDGLLQTIDSVRSKLQQPIPLGYSNVGQVVGSNDYLIVSGEESTTAPVAGAEPITRFRVGDRVVSNGPHAEFVNVPHNLCARIPDTVSDQAATFTVLGAVALQGLRLAQPTLGECFVVTGLGLIGLLTVQILKANGCRVLGIDVDPARCAFAQRFGAEVVDLSRGEDPLCFAHAFSRGQGVDGVLITASTKSNEPVQQAAQMCRKRGRIVLIGVTGLELHRPDFYKKELSFQVSCSYGPGRYDPAYEEKGHDYPIGFVRWTEQRNFEAVLDLMASGRLDVEPLISHIFCLDEAEKAYALIAENNEPYFGVLLTYLENAVGQEDLSTIRLKGDDSPRSRRGTPTQSIVAAMIGAGNYSSRILMPALAKTGIRVKTVASSGGLSGTLLAKKFGADLSTTDTDAIFSDLEINTVFITTRHNNHADLVSKAIESGKHVFVEKPLCLSLHELAAIQEAINSARFLPCVMVGFNRRFAPQVIKVQQLLSSLPTPKYFVMTVNAGSIPSEHWTQDMAIGGGRIIGEACHFVDLLRYLAGGKIVSIQATAIQEHPAKPCPDTVSCTLCFADGSLGIIHYVAIGHRSFPKERLEVFCGGRVLTLDNFRKLTGWGWPDFTKMNLWRQDKGQQGCVAAFIEAINSGKKSPIPLEQIIEVAEKTIEMNEQLFVGQRAS
ncbi:MAG: bi-domain-containing oxidoreductase [Desulfobulbaceae bacterium]|nr:bi-domain-containing oxidoreductase [Desulfobulbaceae bacterium]